MIAITTSNSINVNAFLMGLIVICVDIILCFPRNKFPELSITAPINSILLLIAVFVKTQ
jgi:hypothetical protein